MTKPRPVVAEDAAEALLSCESVVAYLRGRGVLASDDTPVARLLGGGVSNVVIAVEASNRSVVVKQSLGRLNVAEEWFADRDRVLAEADALELVARVTPHAVPAVMDVDRSRHAITMSCAPDSWSDWKTQLLAGHIDVRVAAGLGELLACWQSTIPADALGPRMAEHKRFRELRIAPYFQAVCDRHPEVAHLIEPYADELINAYDCLLHGDFSPKNVLTNDTGDLWVIDWEVATLGSKNFDPAFLLSHLAMKSLHEPSLSHRFEQAARSFVDGYEQGLPLGSQPDWHRVLGIVGCLLLARVAGKSPAEYLTVAERSEAWQLGLALLTSTPDQPGDIWQVMTGVSR